LKDVTNFYAGNLGARVSERSRAVKCILLKNTIYRRVAKKRMVVKKIKRK
jgi:hypothetical protein